LRPIIAQWEVVRQCEPDVAILLSSKEAQIGNQRIAFDFSGERSVVDTYQKRIDKPHEDQARLADERDGPNAAP